MLKIGVFRTSKSSIGAFILFLSCIFDSCLGAESAPETYQEAEEVLDDAARDLDEFLGGKKSKMGKADYHLFVGTFMAYDSRNHFMLKPDLNLRLVLPRFKRRFVLLFNSSDRTTEDSLGLNSSVLRPGKKSDPIQIGLKGLGIQYEAFGSKHFSVLLQEFLRIHYNDWPDPVSRMLVSSHHEWGKTIFENRLGPHWDPKRGFGSLYEPRLRVRLNPNNFLHFSSGFQWWYPDGYFKEESVSLVGLLNRQSAISFETTFEYQITPYASKDFIYSVGYRRRIFYRWLTGQFTPALILDGRDSWNLNYRLALGLQISFGSRYSNMTDFLSF